MAQITQQSPESHAFFEDKAADWDNNPSVKGCTDLVKSWIINQPWWKPPLDGPALDFGCGTGCLTMALRDGLGDNVVGVDTSPAMLEQFERKAEGQGVTTAAVELTGPGELGQDADASFALIYTSLALHHIRDCKRTISALATYLRPGGRLLVFDLEATSGTHHFHPPDFELGNQLEHHGIHEADLRAWCESTEILEDLDVERIPFRKEGGINGAFGSGKEFNMLAFSCVRKDPRAAFFGGDGAGCNQFHDRDGFDNLPRGGKQRGWVKSGDKVVCIHGVKEATAGSTNSMRVIIA